MKINGRQILKKLAAAEKSDRGKVTLYLSKKLYSEFKVKCGKIPVSTVMEELMNQFVESVKN